MNLKLITGTVAQAALVVGLGALQTHCGKSSHGPSTTAPAITTQPASQTVTTPGTATFTVAATGTPSPTFQWNLGGQPITGATAASYTTPATTTGMSGDSYTVTVTNSAGAVTSSAAVLTVAAPAAGAPTLTTDPQSQTVMAPSTATFTVVATGTPAPTYQWNLGGQAIPGATSASFTTAATDVTMSGGSYTVTVSNSAGTITSTAAVLTVQAAATGAPAITTQPTNQTVTAPAPATFTVAASGTPAPTYQWNLNGQPITGATAATYTTPATNLGMSGESFTATVTNSAGTVTSSAAVLTVDAAAQAYQVSGTVTDQTSGTAVPVAGIQLTLNSTPAQTATSDTNGNYAFATAVAPGAYQITPAVPGESAQFEPYCQNLTVASANVTVPVFNEVAKGYNLSGTVTYSGSQQGLIYLACGSSSSYVSEFGTMISKPGPFVIRGLQSGTYNLGASMDTSGQQFYLYSEPVCTGLNAQINGSDLTLQSALVLGDPTSTPTALPPDSLDVYPMDGGAAVGYLPANNGLHSNQTYTLEWSTDPNFGTAPGTDSGTKTFPAQASDTVFITGLTNGSTYSFRMRGTNGSGTAASTSANTAAAAPVTIGPGTGGHTVTGTYTFNGSPTGPLYVWLVDNAQTTGATVAALVRIQSPVSGKQFTIQGVPAGTYNLFGFLDQNQDGLISVGDPNNLLTPGNPASITIDGDQSGLSLVLPSYNSTAIVHIGGFAPSWQVAFSVYNGVKQVVSATLVSGPNVIVPADLALSNYNFTQFIAPVSAQPSPGDTYGLLVTYSDGTSETLTATI